MSIPMGTAGSSGSRGEDVAGLERRREELAGKVAELHWDLGGLAYEMAIRDHFRNDLLLGRAAQLQELDTELAEVERKLGVARAREEGNGVAGTGDGSWAKVLPPARVSAGLLVLFLAFGAAVGMAAKGSRSRAARDDAREVVIAQAPVAAITQAPVAAPAATTPTTAQSAPPAVAAEATPSPSSEPESPSESSSQKTPSSSSPSAAKGKPSTRSAIRSPGGASGKGAAPGAGGGGGTGTGPGSEGSAGAGAGSALPHVKHVFVVMLDDEPYATVFGPASPAHYLAGTLEKKGTLLVRYYAVAHEQLANGIALLSGQGPTPQTAQNCPTYEDLTPGTVGAEGQVSGQGCVYPAATQTLAGQLAAKHLTWKAYVEGMDEAGAPAGAGGACAHPAPGAADPTSAQTPPPGQAYATLANPFVYFHSLIDSSACASDIGLSRLTSDLASAKSTPSFSYIAPGRCDDGNPTPCVPGQAAGMVPADAFLRRVVPEILGSKGYKEGGLLAITVDEAPSGGEFADSSSCCGQPSFPNLPAPSSALGPSGGGQVGALLLSPFIKGGALDQEPYNHFSLLRTVEDLFGLSHLGYAGAKGVSSLGASIFSK
jgi:phosphatidylinositol-3-phosphatase